MSNDKVNPRRREQTLKKRAARKSKWLKRRWRTSAKGNSFINADKHNLVVFPNRYRTGEWSYRIDKEFSKKSYDSESDAKLALFNRFWEILEEEQEDF